MPMRELDDRQIFAFDWRGDAHFQGYATIWCGNDYRTYGNSLYGIINGNMAGVGDELIQTSEP